MKYLESFTFKGKKNGPNLLILGAVHGNEPCGTRAIQRMLKEIKQNTFNIISGSITFIPVCNPKAFEKNVRYVESNLNRHLYPKDNPETYEDELGNELCAYLQQADILLDLHSYSRGGPAFGFISTAITQEEIDLIGHCDLPYAVYGFGEAYKNANIKIDKNSAMGMREYILTQGGYGITIECGQHDDPESEDVAYHIIQNVLYGLGFIEVKTSPPLKNIVRARLLK